MKFAKDHNNNNEYSLRIKLFPPLTGEDVTIWGQAEPLIRENRVTRGRFITKRRKRDRHERTWQAKTKVTGKCQYSEKLSRPTSIISRTFCRPIALIRANCILIMTLSIVNLHSRGSSSPAWNRNGNSRIEGNEGKEKQNRSILQRAVFWHTPPPLPITIISLLCRCDQPTEPGVSLAGGKRRKSENISLETKDDQVIFGTESSCNLQVSFNVSILFVTDCCSRTHFTP